jgi:hypothetical protein
MIPREGIARLGEARSAVTRDSVGRLAQARYAQRRLHEWLQAIRGERGSHLCQRTLHQAQMDRTHDIAVRLSYLPERAVSQPDLATLPGLDQLGNESDFAEDP